ncbi:unnamed protein product [Caenorhabditis auriculariae]|uniref:Uncharacterized protein n=1 Tax=Caenorhabditis auriculariae TaxID=2777116 RepID=A0A8S1H9Q5_9PELO|nr:unnamed protein product [Caenorhabditis auriculariae]
MSKIAPDAAFIAVPANGGGNPLATKRQVPSWKYQLRPSRILLVVLLTIFIRSMLEIAYGDTLHLQPSFCIFIFTFVFFFTGIGEQLGSFQATPEEQEEMRNREPTFFESNLLQIATSFLFLFYNLVLYLGLDELFA